MLIMMRRFYYLSLVKKNIVVFSMTALISAIVGAVGIFCIEYLKNAENVAHAQTMVVIIAAAIAAAIIVCLSLGIFMGRLMANPLKSMVSVANKLSVGDLDTDEQLIYSDDEMGKLADSFRKLISSTKEQVEAIKLVAEGNLTAEVAIRSENDVVGYNLTSLVENLNRIINSIVTASEQVASGSVLVSDAAVALSQGATEQASSVQELMAALDEITSHINGNAQNASNANELALNARKNAASGNEQMKEMLKAMDEISASSSNINKIIKVIDDIAFQTNILALNAAVEAARAGQHGKGFAVVAEEVRTLAAKSANAAKETTNMIENSIKKVEAGIKIASNTAGALQQIVDNVDNTAELIHLISLSSSEQAVGVEQINTGISQVSQVVQTNAATAEESAAASEELSNQAAALKEYVSVFKVKIASVSATLHTNFVSLNRPTRQLAAKSAFNDVNKH